MGVTLTLANQSGHLTQVAMSMLLFGVGAGITYNTLGYLSKATLNRIRRRLMVTGQWGKRFLGIMLIVIEVSIFTGSDKLLEVQLLNLIPAWVTSLTTRY